MLYGEPRVFRRITLQSENESDKMIITARKYKRPHRKNVLFILKLFSPTRTHTHTHTNENNKRLEQHVFVATDTVCVSDEII